MRVNDTTLTMSDSCRKLIISSGREKVVNVLMPSVVNASGIYSVTLAGEYDALVNVISSDNEGVICILNNYNRTVFLTTNGCEWFSLPAMNVCH